MCPTATRVGTLSTIDRDCAPHPRFPCCTVRMTALPVRARSIFTRPAAPSLLRGRRAGFRLKRVLRWRAAWVWMVAAAVTIPIVAGASGLPSSRPGASFENATPAVQWIPPCGTLQVVAGFHPPAERWLAGHRGIDFARCDEPVAPEDGIVTFSGTVVDRGVLTIEFAPGWRYTYEPIESELQAGERVTRGMPLGRAGSGGHCGHHCLHLGVRERDQYRNPMRFFYAKPQLLPW